jgi:predicted RNA-binding Zn-ribbon protein involved in translation (DUF1610 family)
MPVASAWMRAGPPSPNPRQPPESVPRPAHEPACAWADVKSRVNGTNAVVPFQTYIRPSEEDVSRPCPECGAKMRLIWVADAKQEHDEHFLECQSCGHSFRCRSITKHSPRPAAS